RFARRHPQRWLIIAGFLITAVGMILLLALVREHSGVWTWIPGLFLFGAGIGVMLTSSVNVVQSSWPGSDQGDISGLSRSVSNLGSSFGTALVGSVLVAVKLPAGKPFAVALTMMLVFTLIGLVLGLLIPRRSIEATEPADVNTAPAAPPAAAAGASLATAVEAPPAPAAEGPQPSPEPRKRRKLLYATLPGCWGALIFACLCFTPSLLPRGGIVQGLVWGITAAIGYGLGVLAAWVWRAFADRDPRRPRRWAWRTFVITGGVLLAVAFGLGQYWQYEI